MNLEKGELIRIERRLYARVLDLVTPECLAELPLSPELLQRVADAERIAAIVWTAPETGATETTLIAEREGIWQTVNGEALHLVRIEGKAAAA
jgi:hypothetical protein